MTASCGHFNFIEAQINSISGTVMHKTQNCPRAFKGINQRIYT